MKKIELIKYMIKLQILNIIKQVFRLRQKDIIIKIKKPLLSEDRVAEIISQIEEYHIKNKRFYIDPLFNINTLSKAIGYN